MKSSASLLHRIAQRTKIRRTWPLHLMLTPVIAMAIVFSYLPMVGIVIAFQDYLPTKGFFGSAWVGLEHFRYLFRLPNVWQVVQNTLIISVGKIVLTLLTALVFSLLINELPEKRFKRNTQSLLLFPYFVSWVVMAGIIIDLFSQNGIINGLLEKLGVEKIQVLVNPGNFRYLLFGSHVWKEMGYSMVIFLAAIASIDPALYESAAIDGANKWQQMHSITLPSILPMIVLLLTLALGGVLNAGFDQIFVLYSPPVYKTADIIDTYVYRLGFHSAQYSLATAVGILKSGIGLLLIVLSYWLASRFAGYRIF